MRKKTGLFVFLIFFPAVVFGDSFDLQSYMYDFYDEDISVKVEVLRNASFDTGIDESAWPLFENALQYVLDNYEYIDSYNEMNNIILFSLKGLRNTGLAGSFDILWELFLEYPVTQIKAEILTTLGFLGKGNENITGVVSDFLVEQNNLYSSGENVEYTLVSAAITALMELGGSSLYPVLFSVICAGYPEVITSEASGALDFLDGDLNQFFSDIVERNPPEEKYAAFKAGISSHKLSVFQRGRLAELALETTLAAVEESAGLTAMRYASVSTLASLKWEQSSALVVRHYYRMLTAFEKDAAYRNHLIEAIACLGAVGNSDAALALVLQLGIINARKERSGAFDSEITLSIVRALGLIGDKAAFENLLQARNLSYNESITTAAREAIDRLKW